MVKTTYFWDEVTDNVIMESDDAGNVTTYTHTPELHGKVLSQNRNGVKSYYHYDGQGNVRQVTDSAGNVTDEATYTALGETVSKTGSTMNPWGYKGALGYYTNPTTDDLYVRARTLEPSLGRWMSEDPIGFVDGPNLYVYVMNSPIDLFDPSGFACEDGGKCCCCPTRLKYTYVRKIVPQTNVTTCFGRPIQSGPASHGDEFKVRLSFENRVVQGLENDSPCQLDWWERTSKDVAGPGGTLLHKACAGWVKNADRFKELGHTSKIHTDFYSRQSEFKCPTTEFGGFVTVRDCPFTGLRKKEDYRLLCISIRIKNTCPDSEVGCTDVGIDLKQVCGLDEAGKPVCKLTMGRGVCSDQEWQQVCPPKPPAKKN